MKKILSFFVASSVLMMALVACGTEKKDLVVQVRGSLATLDPAMSQTKNSAIMDLQMFEPLLTYNENSELVPAQAKELPIVSDDGLVYTFTLRENLKWSDGTSLTAADYEYAWKRAVNPKTNSPNAEMFRAIAGYPEAREGDIEAFQVQALDDTTLQVTLSSPAAYFSNVVANIIFAPVQKATVEANGENWALQPETLVTNGAFKMAQYTDGESVLIEKNQHYWDKNEIKLDSITFSIQENEEQATLESFKEGMSHLVFDLSPTEIAEMKETDELQAKATQGLLYVLYNTQDPKLSNPNVRKALDLAIDRQYTANTTLQNIQQEATSFVAPGVPDTTQGSEFYDVAQEMNGGEPLLGVLQNIEQARTLLEQAGYNTQNPLQLTYVTDNSENNFEMAQELQQVWAQIGVVVTISQVDEETLLEQLNAGDFQLSLAEWTDGYPDATSILNLFQSENGNNFSQYNNPVYDALLAAAIDAPNAVKRMEHLHQAETMLIQETVASPLVYSASVYLQSQQVKGVYADQFGNVYLSRATIE